MELLRPETVALLCETWSAHWIAATAMNRRGTHSMVVAMVVTMMGERRGAPRLEHCQRERRRVAS